MRRLFFGLEVPVEIRQRLLQVCTPVVGARWQSDEQLHITLLFLGNVEPGVAIEACDAARDLPTEAFALEIRGLGCFGQPQSPRHLWAGVQPCNAIDALHRALSARMSNLGFVPDNRAFCPHVTLARFSKQPGPVEKLLADYQNVLFGDFGVTEFVLFESDRGERGSIYTVVDRFPMSAPGGSD